MTGDASSIPKTEVFTLLKQIGSGSFANVYKAFDKKTKTDIAVKSYRMKKRDPGHFSLAATEMAFLRFLDHPNIITYVLCDIKKEYMYLGIEYSGYGSIIKFMKDKIPLTEYTVQAVMRQLLSAVIYLHSMCIFHGDIKPENVIVTGIENDTLVIKLSDFGLTDVVVMRDRSHLKRVGSFFYMAPEIHLGFPFDYTADLYSCGVLMYEMLFCVKPFSTEISHHEYVTMLRKRSIVICPRFEINFVSRTCVHLLMNLLSYDKQKRLSGRNLARHPFLRFEPIVDTESHFMRACECLLEGVELINHAEYGSGYIDVMEAILHLKIYINRIENVDGVFRYSMSKLYNYLRYCSQIEEKLVSDSHVGNVFIETQSEELRCLLQSTPGLLSAFDVASLGEMLLSVCHYRVGTHMIRRGLDLMSPLMINEPNGTRKQLLSTQIDQWMKILQCQKPGHRTAY